MKRGEIYWVDLGEIETSEQAGKRPCIILQNDKGNLHSPTTIIACCTSQHKKPLPTHCYIKCKEFNHPTTALLEQIRTVDKKRVLAKIGDCDNMEDVERCLKISLGF